MRSQVDDHRLALVVADTSGHGTSAIITALRIKDLLYGALATGLEPSEAADLAAISCHDDDNFVTAFIAIVDISEGTMTFTNAGHQPAVIVTTDKETVLCEATGPLLSGLGGSWSQHTVPLDPGDCLIAFTDGLIEGHGPDGSDLGPRDISSHHPRPGRSRPARPQRGSCPGNRQHPGAVNDLAARRCDRCSPVTTGHGNMTGCD